MTRALAWLPATARKLASEGDDSRKVNEAIEAPAEDNEAVEASAEDNEAKKRKEALEKELKTFRVLSYSQTNRDEEKMADEEDVEEDVAVAANDEDDGKVFEI